MKSQAWIRATGMTTRDDPIVRSYIKWIRVESSELNPDYVTPEISAVRNPFLHVPRRVFSRERKSRVCARRVCV